MKKTEAIQKLIEERKFDEARKLLKKMKRPVAEVNFLWGTLYQVEGFHTESKRAEYMLKAIEHYEKAFTKDPKHHQALFNYATLLRRNPEQELADKSRLAFRRVKKLLPDAFIPVSVYMAFPMYGNSETAFDESLIKMMEVVRANPNIDLMQCRCDGSRITSNRNRLAKNAREKGATHVLFIDTDLDWPVDALFRLLSHDKDIVGATTCKRMDETGAPIGTAVAKKSNQDRIEVKTGGELVEMEVIGCCFMLIRMEVFEKIGLPAFYEPPEPAIEDAIGEDVTFCRVARKAGYKIWMDFDLSVQIGHWGKKRYHIKPLLKEEK